MVRQEEQILAIQALTSRMESRLAAQFVQSVKNLQGKVDLTQIETMLANGQYGAAIGLLNTELVTEGFAGFSETLTEAFLSGGKLAATFEPVFESTAGARVITTFDALNPEMTRIMRDYKMNLIRQLTVDVQQTVRAAVTQSMIEGNGPAKAARDFRDAIGLTDHQERAVQNFRQSLKNKPMDAMRRQLRDRRFDPTIQRAIREKKALSEDQIEKMVKRYREKYLGYRSLAIARTEATRANNMAGHQLWANYVQEGKVEPERVRGDWIYTHDDKTRHAHRTIPSMNPDGISIGQAFKSPLGPIRYPGDPAATAANTINCRCTVFYRLK